MKTHIQKWTDPTSHQSKSGRVLKKNITLQNLYVDLFFAKSTLSTLILPQISPEIAWRETEH